ncbi:DUF1752-domain-containing protein [Sodiomyces alkalinus F11]|uniref:DUF1752-domain-containing protein n=1 Tax=Sodiomyces alkalinus (strain CBS 110278 / VKM F-3762 / F11) TaxID=1314773 RepID=A0A3N2PNZ5_SODAK|nr:DUF1752-domain-containing protein [Sodiomyces alkalinus F11]ROT36232.1 DUF1752-domain-containing protein [Sodiomyces alkalinus F11]
MPFPLDAHVLTVDTNLLHKVDTSNPQNLYGMWTVFARCAESLEQGRRLENISWRLWNRETFCCATDNSKTSSAATSLPQQIPQDSHLADLPQLSGSLDSIADDETPDFASDESAADIVRPRIRRQDSGASHRSRGRERHITADDFEKLVVSIIKEKEPLSAPLPEVVAPCTQAVKQMPCSKTSLGRSGSTTTESSSGSSIDEEEPSQQPSSPELNTRATTVVRGFSPSYIPIPRTVTDSPRTVPAPLPDPTSEPAPKTIMPKKQPMFVMGGSCSSSELDQSPQVTQHLPALQPKRKMFHFGGSSEEDSSIKSALASPKPNSLLSAQKKQASFSNHVTTRTIDNDAAIADDSETDYVDESAIDDDDDSSDWEDSIEDSGRSSIDEKTMFRRVDSRVNLTSRRSLITLMLAHNERAAMLGNAASQSTSAIPHARFPQGPSLAASPNDSDEAPLMMKRGVRQSPLKPIVEIPRSTAQPILASAGRTHMQAALSPRTTRRNMLSTELTESLRRNLLWERQQKSSTANAVLKRRHTSHDVANLKQYPEKAYMNKDEDAGSNLYFQKETFGGYHSKGW